MANPSPTMLPIQQLLSRFKNLTNTERVKKELLCELLNENQIPITIKQVSFSKNSIFLKVHPLIKSELALKKEDILKKLKNLPGFSGIIDIK